ncbi:hypothetical protein DICPUDRAFT_160117, partial [Dictyostelium purpureum]
MDIIPDISNLTIDENQTSKQQSKQQSNQKQQPKQQQQSKQAPNKKVQLLSDEQIKKCSVLLNCDIKNCNTQSNVDNFNQGLPITMVTNKETNDFVIVKVDEHELAEYQLIYSVPKLQPFKNDILQKETVVSSDTNIETPSSPSTASETVSKDAIIKEFKEIKNYYISNKWNGMNIQVFKYFDSFGNLYVSAKPRASPFALNDPKSGPVLDYINQILSKDEQVTLSENQELYYQKVSSFKNGSIPKSIEALFLKKSQVQSVVFELCGSLLPHIVKYDFEIDLKPLFTISSDNGKVSPIIVSQQQQQEEGSFIQLKSIEPNQDQKSFNDSLLQTVYLIKKQLLERNQTFRKENNLQENTVWFNHFIEEGRVLYLLDENVKPKDSEKSHWEQFDNGVQTKVLMCVKECTEKGLEINKENLCKELDMDTHSWSRHESDILSLALPPV